jgi:hypothetical protein
MALLIIVFKSIVSVPRNARKKQPSEMPVDTYLIVSNGCGLNSVLPGISSYKVIDMAFEGLNNLLQSRRL